MSKTKVAIIGSGNIGTDLMIKLLRHGHRLEMSVMVGVDPASDGLARAKRLGVATTHEGLEGLRTMSEYADVGIVFAHAGCDRGQGQDRIPGPVPEEPVGLSKKWATYVNSRDFASCKLALCTYADGFGDFLTNLRSAHRKPDRLLDQSTRRQSCFSIDPQPGFMNPCHHFQRES